MSQRKMDQEHEDLGLLQEMIEAVRAEEPVEAEWQTAQRNLMRKLESSRKENPIMSIVRTIGSTRMGWAAVSAIAVAAAVLVLVFNPLGSGPRDLYAAAMEQIHKARTMTVSYYSEALTFSGLDNVTPGTMEIAYKEPGHLRYTFQGEWCIVICDTMTGKSLTVYPQWKMSDEMNSTRNPNAPNIIDGLRSLPERADEVLEKREMDGRMVQGFRVNHIENEEMKNATVWVDVKSGDPVRIEGESDLHDPTDRSSGKTRTIRKVMSHFKFNIDLDDSLFDLTPPEGYSPGPLTRSRADRPQVEKGK